MADQPNTISDKDWTRLERAAADKYGSLFKNDAQQAAAEAARGQRDKARWS